MKLHIVQPGEQAEDPHAEHHAYIERTKRILAGMRLCKHRPRNVSGCKGCEAWAEAREHRGTSV